MQIYFWSLVTISSFLGLILPTKISDTNFLGGEKSEKNRALFLVQLAGQISENNIHEFLIGSQYEKMGSNIMLTQNLVKNPKMFLTFLFVGLRPIDAIIAA